MSQLHIMAVISNYDSQYGTLPITDQMIRESVFFEGWHPDYLRWPRINGAYDHIPEHQAFHIRYLAGEMLKLGRWLGEKPLLYSCGCCMDGNHRLRAVQFLKPIMAIDIHPQIQDHQCWKTNKCPVKNGLIAHK